MSLDAIDVSERFTAHWVTAQPAVTGYLASVLTDFQDAQDVLQTVAITALKKFSSFDEERSFVRWVLGIARLEMPSSNRGQSCCPDSYAIQRRPETGGNR